jgi:hypothetical protein
MAAVRVFAGELDDGEDEIVGLVERVENFVARDGDRRRAGTRPFTSMKRSLPVPGNAALDVVAELLEFAVGRVEAEAGARCP